MSAASMINAGEIDRFVNDFRRCRDGGLSRNCTDYARERMISRNPSESLTSINSVVAHGRNAIDYGNRANRSADRTVPATAGGVDPAETQRRGGVSGQIRYRYQATVSGSYQSRSGQARTFSFPTIITSSSALSAGEIRRQAIESVTQFIDSLQSEYDALSGADTSAALDVRVDSAYRDRA